MGVRHLQVVGIGKIGMGGITKHNPGLVSRRLLLLYVNLLYKNVSLLILYGSSIICLYLIMTIDTVAVWLVDALRVRRLIPVLNKYLFDLLTVTLGLGDKYYLCVCNVYLILKIGKESFNGYFQLRVGISGTISFSKVNGNYFPKVRLKL